MAYLNPAPVHTHHHKSVERVSVSDHAVVRWLERSGLVDVQQLRDQLADSLEKARSAAAQLHASEFYVRRDGFRYVVKQGVLVTVINEKEKLSRPRRCRVEEE